jgi:hypothetical protein
LAELTEFGFSCSEPMLFLGITIETAATLVPASAMKSAAHAITIDGVGLRLRSRFMGDKSSFVGSSSEATHAFSPPSRSLPPSNEG